MKRFNAKPPVLRHNQRGAITMFSAVLILILLTELVIYALQVGVFEQRKSSNEVRQKVAFHLADSGIQQAKQFLSANAVLASSAVADIYDDGTTDGWLAGTRRWSECSTVATGASGTHPCYGEPVQALRDGSYVYDVGDTDHLGHPTVDLGGLGLPDGTDTRLNIYALLCMLEIDRSKDPVVQGCTTDPAKQDFRYFMVTLLARGEADCNDDDGDGDIEEDECKAQALVAEKIGSFGPGGGEGGPGAPLTARTNVPLSGTVEVVPNPNGGGIGVPISSWVNNNPPDHPECPSTADPITPISGSYSTCERQEWYGMDTYPEDYLCPTAQCECKKGEDKLLSYASGSERVLGIDIVPDEDFPCDLFEYSFGFLKDTQWEKVKSEVPNQLTDCSSLDKQSSGYYWVSGSSCVLSGQIGTAKAPVFLISAAEETKVSATAEFFGVLFVTDVEHPGTAEFTGNGTATIYGAAIMDAEMKNFNGTFQIVYLENVLGLAYDTGAFGAVAGGWTDFHAAWR